MNELYPYPRQDTSRRSTVTMDAGEMRCDRKLIADARSVLRRARARSAFSPS